MATTVAGRIPTGIWGSAGPSDIREWQKWYGANVGKTILVDGQPRTLGADIAPAELWNAFRSNMVGWQPAALTVPPASTTPPETSALAEMAKVDPQSEALRQAVAGSYLTPLQQAGAPTAAQFQTYLDLYKQLDPQTAAARAALGKGVTSEYELGAQLDPSTIREIKQGVRQGQAARGNIYGTPQLVAETMARGSAGEARKQQRMQNLSSYLQSGLSPGDLALSLYNQQQQNLRANQQGALSYLGSGQTPYQAGAGYISGLEQRAANAAQGGVQYNPGSLGQQYLSPQQQQYGLDIGSQSQNYFNSLNNAYGGSQAGGSTKNRTAGALTGAASGAIAGAPLAASTYGLSVVGGALAGGLSGYYG
jgi:hypothetical protein